MDFNVNLENF